MVRALPAVCINSSTRRYVDKKYHQCPTSAISGSRHQRETPGFRCPILTWPGVRRGSDSNMPPVQSAGTGAGKTLQWNTRSRIRRARDRLLWLWNVDRYTDIPLRFRKMQNCFGLEDGRLPKCFELKDNTLNGHEGCFRMTGIPATYLRCWLQTSKAGKNWICHECPPQTFERRSIKC